MSTDEQFMWLEIIRVSELTQGQVSRAHTVVWEHQVQEEAERCWPERVDSERAKENWEVCSASALARRRSASSCEDLERAGGPKNQQAGRELVPLGGCVF